MKLSASPSTSYLVSRSPQYSQVALGSFLSRHRSRASLGISSKLVPPTCLAHSSHTYHHKDHLTSFSTKSLTQVPWPKTRTLEASIMGVTPKQHPSQLMVKPDIMSYYRKTLVKKIFKAYSRLIFESPLALTSFQPPLSPKSLPQGWPITYKHLLHYGVGWS